MSLLSVPMTQAQFKNVNSLKNINYDQKSTCLVISQTYSRGSCKAVFLNLTYSLKLHVEPNKTSMSEQKNLEHYIWMFLYSSERCLFK